MGRKRVEPKPWVYVPQLGEAPLDEFGLPTRWTFLDDPKQTAVREARVKDLMRRLFDAAVFQLGEERAAVAWKAAGKRKRGAKSGHSRDVERDRAYLAEHDGLIAAGGATLEKAPRAAAEKLANGPGPQADTIEKHIRRLLRARASLPKGVGLPSLLGEARTRKPAENMSVRRAFSSDY